MGRRVLLVEGKDDQNVMWNLFEVRRIADAFKVECPETDGKVNESGGIETLLDSIRWRLTTGELECLAIVLDANDKGPAARWQAIRDRLVNAGFDGVPKEHSPDGTVFNLSLRPQSPRSVRFAVWIMPDNHSTGMLEDFVVGLIREDDDMLPIVDGFLDSIPRDKQRFTDAHRPKARVHTWLAIGERPGRPMGQAIKADRQLDANHPTVQPFLDWVQNALID
jgi:hypothetical protein